MLLGVSLLYLLFGARDLTQIIIVTLYIRAFNHIQRVVWLKA
jgi:hypothetical protein